MGTSRRKRELGWTSGEVRSFLLWGGKNGILGPEGEKLSYYRTQGMDLGGERIIYKVGDGFKGGLIGWGVYKKVKGMTSSGC